MPKLKKLNLHEAIAHADATCFRFGFRPLKITTEDGVSVRVYRNVEDKSKTISIGLVHEKLRHDWLGYVNALLRGVLPKDQP